jgi:hypothetical protein
VRGLFGWNEARKAPNEEGLNMTRRIGRPLALVALGIAAPLALALPAFAHHSFGAFDQSKEMTVTGTVKVWRWANPHPMMTITVTDKAAPTQGDYLFEFPAPVQLQDRGYARGLAKVGDTVKIKYNPWRNGSGGGLFKDITTPDGKSLKTIAQ